ncbi:hypothetical protein Hanom_Chr08g00717391 [Helianthus anomalus]
MIELVNLRLQFFVRTFVDSVYTLSFQYHSLFHTPTFHLSFSYVTWFFLFIEGIDRLLQDVEFAHSVCSSAITAFCTSRNFSNIIVATSLRLCFFLSEQWKVLLHFS